MGKWSDLPLWLTEGCEGRKAVGLAPLTPFLLHALDGRRDVPPPI